ncbi:hypothetical protein KDK_65240 [Dictyobacter kobayashii]|uniref:Uncharacterized protein n=1 Tax=Dictyobacter kobayashii TaxID=2014872 RepID=A0A402AUF4_9CHLR|nr:hypothetical protein KDK_65240 [Dictyobacter kobayashii]
MLAFVACIVLITTPIARLGHVGYTGLTEDIATPRNFSPPAMPFLTGWGRWLPMHFSHSDNVAIYMTGNIEILLLLALAFVLYTVAAYFIGKRATVEQMRSLRRWMWIGAIVAGVIFVLTPGMASKDLFVYADYGNLVGAHGANPYFSTPRQVAYNDLITHIDGWSDTPSAYGPVWVYLAGLLSLIFGDHPLPYFYIYRCLGLACHILNVLLIGRILRLTGRSERTITLGMFLYALNPLMLFEGPLGAHNDVFMSTLLLYGFFLCFRANQLGFTRFKHYWPAIVFLTLAVLVKFTSIPAIIFFLLVLAAKTLGTPHTPLREMPWLAALKNVVIAGGLFVVIALAAYLPFWIGHGLGEIVHSFGTPPSSSGAQNSLMRVAMNWLYVHPNTSIPVVTFAAHAMANRGFWSKVDVLAMGIAVLAGIWYTWRSPSMRTLIVGSLGMMTIILIVTPWFYSWYVVWLVALAPVALSFSLGRLTRALVAFCLVFSASAVFTYMNLAFFRIVGYQLAMRYTLMMAPPIIAALIVYFSARARHNQALVTAELPTSSDPENASIATR